MTKLSDVYTPAALVDPCKLHANIERMQSRVSHMGARLRPHVKTSKCISIATAMRDAGAEGFTVSTLKEAEELFHSGVSSDILYAVCIVKSKLTRAFELMKKGCDLKIVVDCVESARSVASFCVENDKYFKVLIEIDVDGHRSGCPADSQELVEVAAALGRCSVHGVMAHAGESYKASTFAELQAVAEYEREKTVAAANALRRAGHSCPVVSIGSTPTALAFSSLEDVTEVRAGVYIFFDLIMHNIGVCAVDDIALSVLTTVIGYQRNKDWLIVDAGWMATSCDQGISGQRNYGFGQICKLDGTPLPLILISTNQEHGIVTWADSHEKCPTLNGSSIINLYPVGSLFRILPVHACATAAQYSHYEILGDEGNDVIGSWVRFNGW